MKKIIFMLGTILFIFTSCSTPLDIEDTQEIIEMNEDDEKTTDSTKTEDTTESTDDDSTETKSDEVTTSSVSVKSSNKNHLNTLIESEEPNNSDDENDIDSPNETTDESEDKTSTSAESKINEDVTNEETIEDSDDIESENETTNENDVNEETSDIESENKETTSDIIVNRLTDKSMYFDDIFEKGESITMKIYINDKFIKAKTLVYNQKSTMIKFKYGNEYTTSLQYNYYIFINSDLDVTNVTVDNSVINVYLSCDVVNSAYIYYTLDTNYNKNNLKDLICNVELNDGTDINEEEANEYELDGVVHKQYKLFSKVMASTDGIDIKLENNTITVSYATSGVVNYGIVSATLENDNLNVVMGKAYSIKTTNK